MSRKARGRPQVRTFECQECGAVTPATKIHGRTQPGHLKDMYCYVCKEITLHIQIG